MSLGIQPEDIATWEQLQHDEKVARMKSILNKVRTLYDDNIPLFTKDTIRKVSEKLENCQKDASGRNRNVILPGIDGVDYKTSVSLPPSQYTHKRKKHLQHIRGPMWVINYCSIEHLLQERDVEFFDPTIAYLPMRILACTMELRLRPDDENDLHVTSTEGLREAFCDIEQKWKMSETYEQLQAALAAVKTDFVLDKVIGVALGPPVLITQVNHHSIIQHALITAIHSILLQTGVLSASSKRFVQDPIYTQQEKDVLCSAGFTVLEGPQAFLTLDNSSILVSISPNVPVKQIVADLCRPGIIIWDRKYKADSILPTDPNSPRVDTMLEQEYYMLDFPSHESFGDLVMYIRKAT
ncbi:hypothetical protein F4678DRAFT_473820 [Xylaria arbuscula]|nr:hypothetical protein F4678DRAFT_473820 [Xylaria arbuscula]